jgi:UDP-glucuronate 4-epimerase
MKFLVTGSAGFIGMYTCKRLLDAGYDVVGLDNFNSYYSPKLKEYRAQQLIGNKRFTQIRMCLSDREGIAKVFQQHQFTRVIHLGAQAGVRHSLEAPFDYIDSNIIGTMTILEGCRRNQVEHLIYASSSSVYGMNPKVPFAESDGVDHPVSLYAATKKSVELMAHSYAHLYGVPTTGLRFFTVYGPAGRPDMAPWLFTEAILKDEPIKVFNNGKMQRDFTYIDDIVEGVMRIQDVIPPPTPGWNESDPSRSWAPYRIYNIGNNNPVELATFIDAIESACGKKAHKIFLPMQDGDVPITFADTTALNSTIQFAPSENIYSGIDRFVRWYREYHQL